MGKPDSSPEAQEAELITKLRQGDTGALGQLYQLYFDRLYSLVFHQVGRNKDIAEDIVQETFLAVPKSVGKFRGQSKFYTWLCSIAYHKIGDFYRKQGPQARQGREHLDIESLANELNPSRELATPAIVESEETRQVVEQALMSLPLDYRQALIFKYVEEMSVREISQIMHRSTKSVEGLLTRGRRALREILADSGEGLR